MFFLWETPWANVPRALIAISDYRAPTSVGYFRGSAARFGANAVPWWTKRKRANGASNATTANRTHCKGEAHEESNLLFVPPHTPQPPLRLARLVRPLRLIHTVLDARPVRPVHPGRRPRSPRPSRSSRSCVPFAPLVLPLRSVAPFFPLVLFVAPLSSAQIRNGNLVIIVRLV